MPGSVNQMNVKITADVSGFKSGMNSAEQQVEHFAASTETATAEIGALEAAAASASQALIALFAAQKVIDFGKQCIEAASDLAEVQNVVDVTFGGAADEVNEWAQSVKDSFGMSELAAKQYASTMGAMLKSSGLKGSAVKDMSQSIAELTADMASFYNLDLDTAFQKIRSGLSGQAEPLQMLGINMSVANLEAYALSKGITKSYQAMSQAEQTQLRYNFLMEKTADAQGDFARTSTSWANQLKLAQENLKTIMADLGNGLIAVLTPVINIVNEILKFIGDLITKIKNWAAGLAETIQQNQAFMSAVSTLKDELSRLWDTIKQILGTSFDMFLANVGEQIKIIIQLATPLIELLNYILGFVNDLLSAFAAIQGWIKSIFGMGAGTDSTVTATAKSMGDMADNTEAAADGMQETQKAAEKLNNTIGGFDELHIIAKDDGGGLDSVAGKAADAAESISDVKKESEDIEDKLSDTFGALADSLKDVGDSGDEAAKKLGGLPPMLDKTSESAEQADKEVRQLQDTLNKGFTPIQIPVEQPAPVHIPIQVPPVIRIPVIPPTPVTIPIEQPHPVRIPIEQPQPIQIPQPSIPAIPPIQVPVEQPAPVHIPIEQPQPVHIPIEQPQPVKIPIEQPQPVEIPTQQPQPVKVPVENPKPIEIPIEHPQPVKVPVENPKPVSVPVEKPAEVEIPVKRPEPVFIPVYTNELEEAKAKVQGLYELFNKQIEIDLQADSAIGDLEGAKTTLTNLQNIAKERIEVHTDFTNLDSIKSAEEALKSLSSSEHDIRVSLNPNAAQQGLQNIQNALNDLTGGHLNEIMVALGGAAAVMQGIQGIQTGLSSFANTEATATVSADTSAVQPALQSANQAISQIDGSRAVAMLEANSQAVEAGANEATYYVTTFGNLEAAAKLAADSQTVSSSVSEATNAVNMFAGISAAATLGVNDTGISETLTDAKSKVDEYGATEASATIKVDAKSAEKELDNLQKKVSKIDFGAIGKLASGVFGQIANAIKAVIDALGSLIDKIKEAAQGSSSIKPPDSGSGSGGGGGGGGAMSAQAWTSAVTPVTSMSVAQYAGGGFPEDGQLFVARESGPEMVGSIGGQTAVANNAQITDAIATAVSSAMTDAMEQFGGPSELTATLSGDDILLAVQRASRRRGASISHNFGFGGR